MTERLATEESILSTRPNATAPLIIPAYEMNTRSLNLIPDLYPNILEGFKLKKGLL